MSIVPFLDESSMTLLGEWDGHDVTGWLASEKYDGCRGYWDGHTLWTRHGKAVKLPDWFRSALPAGVALDGEVWAGHGRFAEAFSAVRWGRFTERIVYRVFDAPQTPGSWVERVTHASRFANEIVLPVSWFTVSGHRHLAIEYRNVEQRGGEGLVLRHPGPFSYPIGRTATALKFKADHFNRLPVEHILAACT